MFPEEKQFLRAKMRRRIAEFSERDQASATIRRFLRAAELWQGAQTIYGFFPLKTEPDWLGEEWPAGKTLGFPRIAAATLEFTEAETCEDFETATHGIRQPPAGQPAPAPDLVLVPGLAFSRDGVRLGRGGGFYDRWLGGLTRRPCLLGVGFACQLADSLPWEPHDVHLDAIVTEKGLFARTSQR